MDLTLAQATVLPIIVGLIAAIKVTGTVSKRWIPVVALFLGVAGVWLYTTDITWLSGIEVGLASMGLWSGGKTVVGK